MKNFLHKNDFDGMMDRIHKLGPDNQRQWGTMTINEMVCHTSDLFRDLLGTRKTVPVTPEAMWPQLVAMVLVEHPWDPNLPTFPPYLQADGGGGTKPVNFDTDKEALISLADQFFNAGPDYQFSPHAGLGPLSREQSGQLAWKHLDHHLRQFGA